MGQKRSTREYKAMLDVVRRYAAGFDTVHGYDARRVGQWSSGKKSTLSRYFNEIHRLTFRPYTVFRPIKKENLIPVQEFSQQQPGYPKIKVAFVPGVVKPEITVTKKGQVIAKDKQHGVTKKTVRFNKIALITDTENEINRVLDENPELTAFRIMAGSFEIANVYGKGIVGEQVIKLMSKYNQPEANNYHANWLHGIIGYQFADRDGFMDFNRELSKAKARIKEERRKLRRKAQSERLKRRYK